MLSFCEVHFGICFPLVSKFRKLLAMLVKQFEILTELRGQIHKIPPINSKIRNHSNFPLYTIMPQGYVSLQRTFLIDISGMASDSEDAIKYPSRQMETLGRGNCDLRASSWILKILDFAYSTSPHFYGSLFIEIVPFVWYARTLRSCPWSSSLDFLCFFFELTVLMRGTWMKRSTRSRIGPESLDRYRSMEPDEQRHVTFQYLTNPQGQGFIAPMRSRSCRVSTAHIHSDWSLFPIFEWLTKVSRIRLSGIREIHRGRGLILWAMISHWSRISSSPLRLMLHSPYDGWPERSIKDEGISFVRGAQRPNIFLKVQSVLRYPYLGGLQARFSRAWFSWSGRSLHEYIVSSRCRDKESPFACSWPWIR